MNPTETLISRQDILDAAERIDPLPASVTRLLSIVANPDNTRGEVVDVIRYDPALSGDVLKRANSTMYAVRNPISDVGEAVGRMGTSTVVGWHWPAPCEVDSAPRCPRMVSTPTRCGHTRSRPPCPPM